MMLLIMLCITTCLTYAAPNIPLLGAVKLGSQKIVKQHLMHSTATINQADDAGNTPLHYAAHSDSYEIAHMLLEHNAAVNARNKQGITALHIAVNHHNKNMVKLLLSYGAQPTIADAHGNTALHNAATYAHIRCGMEIITLLLNHGAAPATCNADNKTAYDLIQGWKPHINAKYAIHGTNIAATEQLLHPATITATDHAEHVKIYRKYIRVAKTNHTDQMRRLLAIPSININIQHGARKRSALMHAIRNNRVDMAHLLIAAGVDTSLRDSEGKSAYDYAIASRNNQLITLLRS